MQPSLKIVIVDKNPIRAAILEDGLREAGHVHVMRIDETSHLLARIYSLDPDVILIDLENPSRDVLEQMFQVSRVVKRPIAMFVDQSDAASIEAAVDAGVSAYIVGGMHKDRIKNILDLCISRFNAFARLQDELDRTRTRARGAQGDRPRQGNSDEREEPQRGRRLCIVAQDRDEREQEDRRGRPVGGHGGGAVEMSAGDVKLRIGFIPLADAAALIVAVDKGFAAAEGLDVELVREVSWSNVRDKLNIGLFDAAHLLAPVAIASSLGIGHVKVPILAPFNLGLNGNAITVSPALYAALADAAAGDLVDPMVSARALARVVVARRKAGRRAAHLRHDLSVLHPQLPAAFLDGGRRRRSGRGYPPGGAAAALYGGQPRQSSGRCVLRRRALELGRGRSRRRPYPAFRLGDPAARGREGSGGAQPVGGGTARHAAATAARPSPRRRLRRG